MEKLKNEKGITLLEIIFSVSILTIGILATAAMQMASIKGNSFAWGTSEASTVAVSRLEGLMNLDYETDADLTNGSHGPSIVTVGKNTYSVTWNIMSNTIMSQTKRIDLTVSWNDHGAKTLLMTYVLGQVI